jgi:hypothetical protein
MSARECIVHPDLEAFVDGELRGARVLEVLDHLDRCAACSNDVADLRALGETIRRGLPAEPPAVEFDGLASTVISRTRAEAAESWPGVFRRAQEDLHWVMVGAGAVAATFVSTLLLSAILAFGPKPDREDSLSALITNVRLPAGTLFLWATPVGDQEPMLVQVDEGGVTVPRALVEYAMWSSDASRTEAALVDALQDAVTDGDHTVALDQMDPKRRRQAEALLVEISRLRAASPLPHGVALAVHEVRLLASARVTVKGL